MLENVTLLHPLLKCLRMDSVLPFLDSQGEMCVGWAMGRTGVYF